MESQDIGLSYDWDFFECSKVFAVAKNSDNKKGKKKNSKGEREMQRRSRKAHYMAYMMLRG